MGRTESLVVRQRGAVDLDGNPRVAADEFRRSGVVGIHCHRARK